MEVYTCNTFTFIPIIKSETDYLKVNYTILYN